MFELKGMPVKRKLAESQSFINISIFSYCCYKAVATFGRAERLRQLTFCSGYQAWNDLLMFSKSTNFPIPSPVFQIITL